MQYSSFGTVLEYEQSHGDFFGVFLYLFLAFLVSNSAIFLRIAVIVDPQRLLELQQ